MTVITNLDNQRDARFPGFLQRCLDLYSSTNSALNCFLITFDYLRHLGIVIKYENMSYKTALHHANQVLGLAGKASKYIKELFDAPDVSFMPRVLVS